MLDTKKARLKAKATAAGAQNLTNARLDAMAAKLNARFPEMSDENEIDAEIDKLYDADDFKQMQAFDDFEAGKKNRQQKKKETETPEVKVEEKTEMQKLTELVSGLATQVQSLTAEKQTASMQEKVKQHEKLKDIDPKLYSLVALPAKDEDIDAWADKVAGVYGNVPSGTPHIPGGGVSGRKTTQKANEKEVNQLVDNMMGMTATNNN